MWKGTVETLNPKPTSSIAIPMSRIGLEESPCASMRAAISARPVAPVAP